mgnify:CR=1 FL=1
MVPFIRPYRTRADVSDWSTDPSIYELIESEYRRGYFRGIGEFHIYGDAGGPAAGQEDGGVRRARATFIFLPIAMRVALEILLWPPQRRQDHLGPYRLFSTPAAQCR